MTRNAQFLWLVAIAVLLRVRAVHPQEKWQSAGMINYEENCDFWGGDFSQYNSKTCGADCVANNYCTHYTSILKCPLAWLWLGNLGCEFQCALKHFSVGSAKPTNVGYVQGQLVSCGYIPSRYRIWQDGDNGQVQWAPDCDFSGNDIAKQSSDSAEKCRGLCLADGACTHFTWLSNVCTLKRVATGTAKDQDLAGAVCGFVPSRYSTRNWLDGGNNNGQVKYAPGCDFFGNDIARQWGPVEQCGWFCLANSACTHFTWLGYTCALKRIANGIAKDTDLNGAFCGLVPSRVNSL